MGTDNLHHKRKARKESELARKAGKRAPYSKVLIVTEGSKTEPLYFTKLRQHYRINKANMTIDGRSGSNPLSVVRHGRELYKQEKNRDPFDYVYCVFDKDKHGNYRQALEEIKNAKPEGVFIAITSVPCFEYWLLLHYVYTTAPYQSADNTGPAQQVISELKKHLPDYEKGRAEWFTELLDKLEKAKQNAEKSLATANRTNTDNPSTRVHRLVEYLQNYTHTSE